MELDNTDVFIGSPKTWEGEPSLGLLKEVEVVCDVTVAVVLPKLNGSNTGGTF